MTRANGTSDERQDERVIAAKIAEQNDCFRKRPLAMALAQELTRYHQEFLSLSHAKEPQFFALVRSVRLRKMGRQSSVQPLSHFLGYIALRRRRDRCGLKHWLLFYSYLRNYRI